MLDALHWVNIVIWLKKNKMKLETSHYIKMIIIVIRITNKSDTMKIKILC